MMMMVTMMIAAVAAFDSLQVGSCGKDQKRIGLSRKISSQTKKTVLYLNVLNMRGSFFFLNGLNFLFQIQFLVVLAQIQPHSVPDLIHLDYDRRYVGWHSVLCHNHFDPGNIRSESFRVAVSQMWFL